MNLYSLLAVILGIPATIISAVAGYRKARPAASVTIIKGAEDVVVIQRRFIAELVERVEKLEAERQTLRDERDVLRRRVDELEAHLSAFEDRHGGDRGEGPGGVRRRRTDTPRGEE